MADAPAERVVRVLPDVPAIDKTFDYLVPDAVGDQVRVGTVVRVQLHGRRVGAWVVADGVEPPPGVALRPLAKVTGWGPAADLIDRHRRVNVLRRQRRRRSVRGRDAFPFDKRKDGDRLREALREVSREDVRIG